MVRKLKESKNKTKPTPLRYDKRGGALAKKKHRGQIIEIAIRSSGYSLVKISDALGISRSTLYNRFRVETLPRDFIKDVSRVIHYDFVEELPELFGDMVEDGVGYYKGRKDYEALNVRFCKLLESHNALLKVLLKMISKGEISEDCKIELMKFIEQRMN